MNLEDWNRGHDWLKCKLTISIQRAGQPPAWWGIRHTEDLHALSLAHAQILHPFPIPVAADFGCVKNLYLALQLQRQTWYHKGEGDEAVHAKKLIQGGLKVTFSSLRIYLKFLPQVAHFFLLLLLPCFFHVRFPLLPTGEESNKKWRAVTLTHPRHRFLFKCNSFWCIFTGRFYMSTFWKRCRSVFQSSHISTPIAWILSQRFAVTGSSVHWITGNDSYHLP